MTLHTEKRPVDLDVSDQVLALFGTVANAQRALRVQHVPYLVMNMALKGNPVPIAYTDVITEAWRSWKQVYVRGVALGLTALPPDWRVPKDPDGYLVDLLVEEQVEWERRLR